MCYFHHKEKHFQSKTIKGIFENKKRERLRFSLLKYVLKTQFCVDHGQQEFNDFKIHNMTNIL